MEAYRGVEVEMHPFLTFVLEEDDLAAQSPRKSPLSHGIVGWVGPRIGLSRVFVYMEKTRIMLLFLA